MAVTVPARFAGYSAAALELFLSTEKVIDDDWLTLTQNSSFVYASAGLGTIYSAAYPTPLATTASWVTHTIHPYTFSEDREATAVNTTVTLVGTNVHIRVSYWNTAYTVQIVGPITITVGSGTVAPPNTANCLVEIERQYTIAGGTIDAIRIQEGALTTSDLP